MLAPTIAIHGGWAAVRSRLWAFFCWLGEAMTREVIPLTGDPDVDAALIEMYLRGCD